MEDDVQLPTFLFQRTNQLPEEEPWRIEEKDLRKWAKYLIACKNNLWKKWQRKYLVALRERHNLVHKTAKYQVKEGDAVFMKTDDKNRGKWPLAIVQQLFPGPDGYTRAVQLRTKNRVIERPVQHLYPLELHCNGYEKVSTEENQQLNPNVCEFVPRRAAAAEAVARIKQLAEKDEQLVWTSKHDSWLVDLRYVLLYITMFIRQLLGSLLCTYTFLSKVVWGSVLETGETIY